MESSKVTYFRCKESKIIKISHFQNIAWRFWAQEERKSVCNFLLSLEMDQNAQNMIILFKKDFVLFQSDMLSSLSEESWFGTQKKRSFHPVTSSQTPWWQPTCPSGSWKPRSKALVLTMPAAKQGHNSVLAWKMQAFALVVAISILSIFLSFFLAYGRRLGGMKKRKTGVVYCKWRIVKVPSNWCLTLWRSGNSGSLWRREVLSEHIRCS